MTVTRGSPLLRARRGLAPPLNPLAIATKGWWTTDGAVITPPLVFCPPIFRELAAEGIRAIAQTESLPVAAVYAGVFPVTHEADIPLLPQCTPYIGEAPNVEFICCED